MSGAYVLFGVLFGLFGLVDLVVVVLRRQQRLEASRWPSRLFNWPSALLSLVLAVLLFVGASLG